MSQQVFGADHKTHPVTGLPLESGIGSLPEKEQGYSQCDVMEQTQGKEAADAMRQKIKDYYDPPEPLPEPELSEFSTEIEEKTDGHVDP